MGGNFTPFGGTIDNKNCVPEFGGFQRGSGDAGAENELTGVDEAAEVEASAGTEEGTHLGGELLLPVDPLGIHCGRKGVHGLLA
jgi:hypothetical protein